MSDPTHPFNRPEFTLKQSRPKKRLLIIILGVVLLLVASAGAVYFFRDQLFGAPDVATSQRDGVDEEALNKTTADANVYLVDGDTATAVTIMDEAIEKTDSDAQKSALYHNKATIAAGTDLPGAIVAVEQSVALNPNFENTAYAALLYERIGNNAKAIEYYEKAIVLFNKMDRAEDSGPIDASLYQERIDRLRGQ